MPKSPGSGLICALHLKTATDYASHPSESVLTTRYEVIICEYILHYVVEQYVSAINRAIIVEHDTKIPQIAYYILQDVW
jgi:hypothetical protein